MKKFVSKISNLLVFLFIFSVMTLPLHEGGHSLVAQCFGYTGRIEIDWFNISGSFVGYGNFETWEYIIIAFSGGGFVALLYALMLWFSNVGIKWDENEKTPIRIILGVQLGYAIGETTLGFKPDIFIIASLIGIVVGALGGLFWSLPKLFDWWER